MGEAFSSVQILEVSAELISIGQHLVHASVFGIEHGLHLGVGQSGSDRQSPVTVIKKHLQSGAVACIQPGITQAGKHFVHIIPGHPGLVVGTEISICKADPKVFAAGNSSQVMLHFRTQLNRCLLTAFQADKHAVHSGFEPPLGQWVVSSGIMNGQSRKVMSSHVPVQAGPIAKSLSSVVQAGLFVIGLQQTSHIVFQQVLNIQIHRPLKRAVQQTNILQGKLIGIQCLLRLQRTIASKQIK